MQDLQDFFGFLGIPEMAYRGVFEIAFFLGVTLAFWGSAMLFYSLIDYDGEREDYGEMAGWAWKWACIFLIVAGVWRP